MCDNYTKFYIKIQFIILFYLFPDNLNSYNILLVSFLHQQKLLINWDILQRL